MHQALIWSTDESLSLLRYNGPTLIDAKFRTGPIEDRNSMCLSHTHFRLRKVNICIVQSCMSLLC
ncbi:hypothetical protein HZS_3809 [Henneguya salminicola]|nr:hypothetical protein HZS_3809 [Henneguya salminicola]